MVIAFSIIKVRDGHMDKLLAMLKDNINTAKNQKGFVESYIAKNAEKSDEVLLYSLWQTEADYEAAKKTVKQQYKKAIFQFLSHISKQPQIELFEVL